MAKLGGRSQPIKLTKPKHEYQLYGRPIQEDDDLCDQSNGKTDGCRGQQLEIYEYDQGNHRDKSDIPHTVKLIGKTNNEDLEKIKLVAANIKHRRRAATRPDEPKKDTHTTRTVNAMNNGDNIKW